MSIVASTAPFASSVASFYKLSVDQYHALLEQGILRSGDRVELLRGYLVEKMSKNPPHSSAARLLRRMLGGVLPQGWFLDGDTPLTTLDSEPEPDLMVVRGTEEQYSARHPTPADIELVIEISDSSLRQDRGIKLPLYAEARIAVYWIVNVVDGHIEVYTDPTGPDIDPTYRQRQILGTEDLLPVVIEGREVGRLAIADLLPARE